MNSDLDASQQVLAQVQTLARQLHHRLSSSLTPRPPRRPRACSGLPQNLRKPQPRLTVARSARPPVASVQRALRMALSRSGLRVQPLGQTGLQVDPGAIWVVCLSRPASAQQVRTLTAQARQREQLVLLLLNFGSDHLEVKSVDLKAPAGTAMAKPEPVRPDVPPKPALLSEPELLLEPETLPDPWDTAPSTELPLSLPAISIAAVDAGAATQGAPVASRPAGPRQSSRSAASGSNREPRAKSKNWFKRLCRWLFDRSSRR